MLLLLLERLKIKRFSIVGNIMCAMMAAKRLDDMPERIE
ncbi:MAG: hypothetical protein ACJASL_005110 [Paraglaciecola sp.]|jgi:hypothetical protein